MASGIIEVLEEVNQNIMGMEFSNTSPSPIETPVIKTNSKALSSKALSVVSIAMAASLFVVPAVLLIIVLPISLILGIFSLLQARKEKASFAWGIVAIISAVIVFLLIQYSFKVDNDKIIQELCDKNPEYFECVNGELKTKEPQINY